MCFNIAEVCTRKKDSLATITIQGIFKYTSVRLWTDYQETQGKEIFLTGQRLNITLNREMWNILEQKYYSKTKSECKLSTWRK